MGPKPLRPRKPHPLQSRKPPHPNASPLGPNYFKLQRKPCKADRKFLNIKVLRPDFCIKVGNLRIPVHKDFLCAVSEYFRAMLNSGLRECEENTLHVRGTNAHVVRQMIKYLYGEIVNIRHSHLTEYLDIIELWQLTEVKLQLERWVAERLTPENCIEWLLYADLYGLMYVESFARGIMKSKFVKVSQSDSFKLLDISQLESFIKDWKMGPTHNYDVLEGCINWILVDETPRIQEAGNLLEIALTGSDPATLTEWLKAHNITGNVIYDTITAYKLQRPAHQADEDFPNIKQQPPDFYINVEDERIPVHRDFLCAVSEYFQMMIHSRSRECDENTLHIKGTKSHVVHLMIKYLYGEKVNLYRTYITEYMDLILLWQLTEAKLRLDSYIAEKLTLENCIEWLRFADLYGLVNLQSRAIDIIKAKFFEVSQSDGFKLLDVSGLQSLIQKVARLVSVEDILEGCINWILADESSRKQESEPLIHGISLSKCNPIKLKRLLKTYSITDGIIYDRIQQIVASTVFVIGNDGTINSLYDREFNKISEGFRVHLFDYGLYCKTSKGIMNIKTGECELLDYATNHRTKLPTITQHLDYTEYESPIVSVENTVYQIHSHTISGTTILSLDLTKTYWKWEELIREAVFDEIIALCAHQKTLFMLFRSGQGLKRLKFICFDTKSKLLKYRKSPPLMYHAKCIYKVDASCVYMPINTLHHMDRAIMAAVDDDIYCFGPMGPFFLKYNITKDTWVDLSPKAVAKGPHNYALQRRACTNGVVCDDGKIRWISYVTERYYMEIYDVATNTIQDVKVPEALYMSSRPVFCFTG